MIFDDLCFFNVREVIFDCENKAYELLRLPLATESSMDEQGIKMNRSSVGCEIRFYLDDDEVELFFIGKDENSKCYVYFQDMQAEWFQSTYTIINGQKSGIKIKKPLNEDLIEQVNAKKHSVYPNKLVRIVFDGGRVDYVCKVGKTLPFKEKLPTYLAYGSSITSNSITYLPELCFCNKIAKYFHKDLVNLGSPGSCLLQYEVTDEINKVEFDIATFELGTNALALLEVDEFSKRVDYFVKKITENHKESKIYLIDYIFAYPERCGIKLEKLNAFSDIVYKAFMKYNVNNNLILLNGRELFKDIFNVCADLVHPDIYGHEEIYLNFIKNLND